MTDLQQLKFTEILAQNNALGLTFPEKHYKVKLLANIVVPQLNEILEFVLRSNSIPAEVSSGEYDNIVQDSFQFKEANLIIIFWETLNVVNSLFAKYEILSADEIEGIIEKAKQEIDMVFSNLAAAPLLLVNRFSSLLFTYDSPAGDTLTRIAAALNAHLESKQQTNCRLIETDKIIAAVGIANTVNRRNLYSSMAPYSLAFFKQYVTHIYPLLCAATGKTKKLLILDCDGTLWNGVLGEAGYDGIDMNMHSKTGKVFHEVQNIILSLAKQGVLLGICSKNNPEDVDRVLQQHPDMVLRDEIFAIKKINWNDKAANIREMAEELNLGLDSFVFLDDSAFETELVRNAIPEVAVIKVPDELHDYPAMVRENCGLFYKLSVTKEDLEKANVYKQEFRRESEKKNFAGIEQYLSSLELQVTVHINDAALVQRMAQLTQKTNQFNLTTKRRTENEISNFIGSDASTIIAINVSDKFGGSGITGLCILTHESGKQSADIDTLLLSCRVLGRNIEFVFMQVILDYLAGRGCKHVTAEYKATQKNMQVSGFYEKAGFTLVDASDNQKKYTLDMQDRIENNINYIGIVYAE